MNSRPASMPVWLRTLIILIALPPWLGTVAVYLWHGEPPPAEILTLPLGFIAAATTPGMIADIGRRVLNGGGGPAPPPAAPGDPREEGSQP